MRLLPEWILRVVRSGCMTSAVIVPETSSHGSFFSSLLFFHSRRPSKILSRASPHSSRSPGCRIAASWLGPSTPESRLGVPQHSDTHSRARSQPSTDFPPALMPSTIARAPPPLPTISFFPLVPAKPPSSLAQARPLFEHRDNEK